MFLKFFGIQVKDDKVFRLTSQTQISRNREGVKNNGRCDRGIFSAWWWIIYILVLSSLYPKKQSPQ